MNTIAYTLDIPVCDADLLKSLSKKLGWGARKTEGAKRFADSMRPLMQQDMVRFLKQKIWMSLWKV